jgi:GMP synthase-like glutamine amidotransferase
MENGQEIHKKMNVHVLKHVPFEDIGSMASWLDARGAVLSYTRFFEDPTLPRIKGLDLIVAMGGPMSVNDESDLAWLRPEKEFVRDAVARGIPVLGVCLGAQLIASALGSRVYRNPQKEIGWFQIDATPAPGDAFRFPEKCTVFHWHGETFDLPSGAVRLARSAACENQAFQIGRHVIGLQFHLETTPESGKAILDHCKNELVTGGPYVQTESELREVPSTAYAAINRLMIKVLAYITNTSDQTTHQTGA